MENHNQETGSPTHTPMGYHNPYMKNGVHAPFSICGGNPDGSGGGVQFWAYSRREANQALGAYRVAGYLNVLIRPEGKED